MKACLLAAFLLSSLFSLAQPSPAAKEQLPVVACEQLGNKIKSVDPKYPELAKVAHIQGDVVLSAVIDKKGRVKRLQVVSGHPVLAKSAMDAVKQWRYRPYKVGNKKVEVATQITVKYHM